METKVKNNSKLGYESVYNRIFKRWLDFTIALIAIIVLLPIILLFSLAVLIDSGFPIFYTPLRGGYNGKPFKIIKYRTMVKDADKIGGGTTALNDPRITKVGSILRKVKADEIVQIFNVLTGTMSFVGPRPEMVENVDKYTEELPEFSYRLRVKGGLTGYAQIAGKYNTSPKDKLVLDLMYIEKYSLWLDFKLIMQTLTVFFRASDSTKGFEKEKNKYNKKYIIIHRE